MARLTLLRILTPLAAALVLAACQPPAGAPPKQTFNAVDVTGADYARALTLPDADGKLRSLSEWKGKVVVLFFGYTQCPDACPTTLSALADAMQRLGADAANVQVLFITVDPDRDTTELLSHYVTAFNPTFIALAGDADATARTAKEFKVLYQKQPGQTPGTYTMDHSAGSFVFDAQGRLRLYAGQGQGGEAFAHDIRALLRG